MRYLLLLLFFLWRYPYKPAGVQNIWTWSYLLNCTCRINFKKTKTRASRQNKQDAVFSSVTQAKPEKHLLSLKKKHSLLRRIRVVVVIISAAISGRNYEGETLMVHYTITILKSTSDWIVKINRSS